jgi:ABC-2 type transport system ATP-binding protein
VESDAFETVRTNREELTVKIRDGFRPNDVLEHFLRRGSNILSFSEMLPSLNEIFIRLVEGTPTARQFEKNEINP